MAKKTREVWATTICMEDKPFIEIPQLDIKRDDNAMQAAQDVAHKIFSKGYFHIRDEGGREIYIPREKIKEVFVCKISVAIEEETDGKKSKES